MRFPTNLDLLLSVRVDRIRGERPKTPIWAIEMVGKISFSLLMAKFVHICAWIMGSATFVFGVLAFLVEVRVTEGVVTNFFGTPLGEEHSAGGPLGGYRAAGLLGLLDIFIFFAGFPATWGLNSLRKCLLSSEG